ncbi:MAG: N-acetylmuramoyl-L-alanine amidase [Candidatus Babeliales bacterium]|jgi:N-acetylmuramoyl-L-alanine amidase
MGPLQKAFCMCSLFLLCLSALQASEQKEENHLNWVEICKNKLSTQIMFDFSGPVLVQHEIDKQKHNLCLTFPGMTLLSFNPESVMPKMDELKKSGLIKSIAISERTGDNPAVVFTLEFASHRDCQEETTQTVEHKRNQFLVKWNTIDSPYRLIVDIFMKEDLEKIIHKDAVLLQAANDVQQYGLKVVATTPPPSDHSHTRITIDAGHGGQDTGARGYLGLLEKDIALDISQRLYTMLKNDGYNVLLTRTEDKELSLFERSQLAHQLGTNLFVSIHVNASQNKQDTTWGVETFYLTGQELMNQRGKTGYLFVNMPKDISVISKIDNNIQQTMDQSKTLAQSIQQNIISTLADRGVATNNRGVKQEKFRVLLRAEVPAALVEVGFITNRNEANRLAKTTYRATVASGVYDGIRAFLNSWQPKD